MDGSIGEYSRESAARNVLLLLFATLLLALSMTLAGCGGGEPYEFEAPADEGDPDTTWTVMMYLCGSDLESEAGLATDNITELLGCDLGENVTYVIETGGASEWHNDTVNPRYLERYAVSSTEGMTLVDQLDSASMGVADSLSDFISWADEAYPSDRRMLVFWDHGGGALAGVCADELYQGSDEQSDTLLLPEIKEALNKAGVKFDIIGFDTCLMATLETAETVAPWGDYLVASEESEPGGGWAYDAWPEWLGQYPGIAPVELARGICDSYYHKCENSWDEDMATLSVTDLAQIPELSKAFRDASGAIVLATGNADSLRLLHQGATRAENYGGNTDAEGYTDMVDLGDLMANTSGVLGKPADAVSAALDKAVVYAVNGPNRSRSQGLSVFYPLALNKQVYDLYAQVTDNTSYLQYLAVLNGDYDALEWNGQGAAQEEGLEPLTEDDFDIKYKQEIDKDYRLRLTITSGIDAVASVRIELGFYNEDDGYYLPLGTDNNLEGNWGTGVFTDLFEGEWLAIDGNFVNAQLAEENDDYNLYTIPIMLNGKRSNLKVAWEYDKEAFRILGAYDGIDEATGTSGKSIRNLKDGDQVTFLFDAIDLETDESIEFDLATITWKDGMKLEDTELSDGDYLYRYEIVDIFGNTIYTDPAIMTYEDGQIYVEEW